MIQQILQGGLAGLAATAPMTAVMEAWHRRLPFFERYPLPPRQITVHLAKRTGVAKHLDDRDRNALTMLAHFAYGATMGGIYAAAARQPAKAGAASGAMFGLAVWAGSYLGLLPALKILPPATRHSRRRNALMIVAHLVWGAAMGACTHTIASATEQPE